MTKYILFILSIFFLQLPLQAFNGEKRLSKNNVVSIHSNKNSSLLLNDESGNIFDYNGDQVQQIDFVNNIDFPTVILSNENGTIIYVTNNTVFIQNNDESVQEILSIPKFEKTIKLIQNEDYYFISSSSTLYQVEKSTRVVTELYKNNINQTDKIVCTKKDCYLAMNNIVINLSKKDVVEHTLPSVISDLEFNKEHGLLSLSDGQIYISEKVGSRKLFPITGNIPTGIKDICGSERWLYMITENSVSVFDWINSEVRNLGKFNGFIKSTHIDDWNNLWLSTNQGIWNFPAYNSFSSPKIISIKLTDQNNTQINPKAINFNQDINLINVSPKIVYLPNTESILTEWRVEDQSWRPYTKDFVISNEMLSDGINNIYIRAKTKESDYSLPFKIKINNSTNDAIIPPGWFAALGLIGSLLFISFISLFNLRTKQNESRFQIEKLKAENELLQSKQQIDQLKMNPHFIFNALNSINGLIATGKIPESRKAIALFSKFLRQFLYQSQGENILLEDEVELLENYLKIELVCRSDKFTFEIEIQDDSLLDVKVPNMVIQPFIENAIIHAFTDFTQKGKIKLLLKEEDGYLIACITDNGKGINIIGKKSDHKSVAVDLVRKRLALRDKNRRKTYVEYHENKPGTIAKIFLQRL